MLKNSTLNQAVATQNKVTMKSIAVISTMIFLYSASFAQGTRYHQPDSTVPPPNKTEAKRAQRVELGDLKGPRAKNYPTHAYQSSEVVVTAPTKGSEKRVGPAAKNYRPWQDDTQRPRATITKKKKENLKGPRAKNRKPWNNR